MKNDRAVLGVSADADQKEIKKAYFKLVRQFSPEKDPERFQEIRGAYERLQQAEVQEKEGNLLLTMEMPDEPFAHSMMKQIDRLERQGDFEGAAATAKEAVSRFGEYEAFLYELGRSQLYSIPGKTNISEIWRSLISTEATEKRPLRLSKRPMPQG